MDAEDRSSSVENLGSVGAQWQRRVASNTTPTSIDPPAKRYPTLVDGGDERGVAGVDVQREDQSGPRPGLLSVSVRGRPARRRRAWCSRLAGDSSRRDGWRPKARQRDHAGRRSSRGRYSEMISEPSIAPAASGRQANHDCRAGSRQAPTVESGMATICARSLEIDVIVEADAVPRFSITSGSSLGDARRTRRRNPVDQWPSDICGTPVTVNRAGTTCSGLAKSLLEIRTSASYVSGVQSRSGEDRINDRSTRTRRDRPGERLRRSRRPDSVIKRG